MIEIADIIKKLPHSPTLWANDLVHDKRSKGEDVFHMGFGESPFPAPERLQKALANYADHTEYLKADGLQDLKAAVKEYYRPVLGDAYIDASDIIIAPGSKLILYSLQMAIEGDLLMPVPSWVSYEPQAKMLHTKVLKVPTTLDDAGYHISAEDLRGAIQKGRAEGLNPTKIILNAPNNPTGLTIPKDELSAIAKVCQEEGVLIISDEIYGFVDYQGEYNTIAPCAPEITAVTTGLSKHLSLGGWRIGVGFIPKGVAGLHKALRGISSETWSCVSAPLQFACIEAYKHHQDIDEHMQACTDIHELMTKSVAQGLKDIGVECPMAQGAFYCYPNFAPFRDGLAANGITTAQHVHEALLERYNLATLPGSAFGAEPEVLTLRLSACDYDGAAALKAYQGGAVLDRAFIAQYAPNILGALDAFARFVEECAGGQVRAVA